MELVDAPNTFILRNSDLFADKGVIVIQTDAAASELVIEGRTVAVTGTLRPYIVADLEDDYDLTWQADLQERLEAEYQLAPVIIADSVFAVE